VVEALSNVDAKALFALEPSLIEEAGECGLRPAFFAMGLLDGRDASAELLSYEAPFGVGYAVVKFKMHGIRRAEL
jgi:aromatic ring-opening dioxygenase LigB subunit